MMLRNLILAFALFFPALPSFVFAQAPSTAPPAPQMRSSYGQKIHIAGIPNSGKINDSLYRGAQPQITALEELRKLGITTIVDLRSEDHSTREREKAEAERLGMHFLNIPVGGFSAPTNDQVVRFLSLFSDNAHEKVFVHCHYGEDRTGVFIAAYRITFEKWPLEQAVNEMHAFGFNSFWQRDMKSFVRDFPGRLHSAPAFAPFQSSP